MKKINKEMFVRVMQSHNIDDKFNSLPDCHCSEIEAENKKFKEALEFYANPKNYEVIVEDAGCGCCSDVKESPIDTDDGKIATEALKDSI